MAVAHRALQNFLVALVLLSIAAAWAAVMREPAAVTPPIQLALSRPAPTTFVRVAVIGPFPDADHVLDRDVVFRCLRGALTPELRSMIGGWQIVGRVDKRQLRIDKAALYGSNQALAMSRAVWVRDQVLSQLPGFNSEASIVSVGGAGQVGANVTAPDLQLDRAVDVYALVALPVSQEDASKRKLGPPALCPS